MPKPPTYRSNLLSHPEGRNPDHHRRLSRWYGSQPGEQHAKPTHAELTESRATVCAGGSGRGNFRYMGMGLTLPAALLGKGFNIKAAIDA